MSITSVIDKKITNNKLTQESDSPIKIKHFYTFHEISHKGTNYDSSVSA